eukprot:CAMPEP_0168314700 /NCGR_PEP_ID=MMETSP0210-20121227/9328_1 /TAXON_ID=40633 /ORGANISM="Condylostoma magnum, Strain COL2" /LENGTH=63 /DNA_ID=CAMNT_0008284769 /DNA_START=982 /DNA_END=1169 /DNA_ORIENTATION=-
MIDSSNLVQSFMESYDLFKDYIAYAHGFGHLEIEEDELWNIATGKEWQANKNEVLRTVMCSFV